MLLANMGLIPIVNFGRITGNVYRGGQPHHDFQWRWLVDKVGVDVFINLRSEADIDKKHVLAMGVESGKTLTARRIAVPDHEPPTFMQALDFTGLIQEYVNDGLSVFFHCEHGQGRTSTFSVIAKIALGWDADDALQDEARRFGYTFHHHKQAEFITRFINDSKALEAIR